MKRGLSPDRTSLPITAGATDETVALHRWLLTAKKHRRFALGTNDMLRRDPAVEPNPVMYEAAQTFYNITGKWPGVLGMEYHDPAWANRYGSLGTDVIRNAMIQAHARGAIVALHNHPNNPVTGQLSRNGSTWSGPQTSGGYADRSGNPLAAIKTGGAQEAQFLAWMDRMADFINSLVDASGRKIPVILRPFHEINGTWFWWNGADRAADMVIVWQKFVTYMKDVKGLTNVLYCWNVNVASSSNFYPWWPGRDYVDMISLDAYDNSNLSTISFDRVNTSPNWDFLLDYATRANKSLSIPECGYQYTATQGGSDLWDVRTGNVIRDRYPQTSLVGLWPEPYGPSNSDPAALKASLLRWANDPCALTAERLSAVYGTNRKKRKIDYAAIKTTWDGHSIMAGSHATSTANRLPARVMAAAPFNNVGLVANVAVGGQTIRQMNGLDGGSSADVDGAWDGSKTNMLFVWGASNSADTRTAEEMAQDMQQYLNARLALHPWIIILISEVPRLDSINKPRMSQRLHDYNKIASENWQAWGCAEFVDTRPAGGPFDMVDWTQASFELPATRAMFSNSDPANVYTHLSNAGFAYVAGLTTAAVQRL